MCTTSRAQRAQQQLAANCDGFASFPSATFVFFFFDPCHKRPQSFFFSAGGVSLPVPSSFEPSLVSLARKNNVDLRPGVLFCL